MNQLPIRNRVAIRSGKARALVNSLSERHGQTIKAVIEEALERMIVSQVNDARKDMVMTHPQSSTIA